MNYAPILVSVYSRIHHFKNCIASLQLNPEAQYSDLFIVSDAASRDTDVQAVKDVREFALTINGFKTVSIILRECNLGFFESVVQAQDYVMDSYGRMIFLEDDVEVSQSFLRYLNDGLEKLCDNKHVYSIAAYCPISACSDNVVGRVFSAPFHCPWGYATWKDRQINIDVRKNNYPEFIEHETTCRLLAKNSPLMIETLRKDYFYNIAAADVRISCQMMLRDMFSVYPSVSLTRNTGFDGTGERMGVNDEMAIQIVDDDYPVNSWEPVQDQTFMLNVMRHGTKIKFSTIFYLMYRLEIREVLDPLIVFARFLRRVKVSNHR